MSLGKRTNQLRPSQHSTCMSASPKGLFCISKRDCDCIGDHMAPVSFKDETTFLQQTLAWVALMGMLAQVSDLQPLFLAAAGNSLPRLM